MKAILVIDDFATARLYHASLLRQLGHEAVEAGDGEEALALTRNRVFDLILLDLLMPRLTGAQFLQRLRGDPRYTSVPVLAVTSEKAAAADSTLDALGVSKILVKPVLPADLRRAVTQHLPALSL
ncbi:MAG: response regulator [Opitutales bacterium]